MPDRALAHDDPADGAVAGHEAGVDPQLPIQLAEILAKALPVPGHARLQARHRHSLHSGQHAHQVGRRLGAQRRDAEAAVAAEHGGHAVIARRAQGAVPEDLRVVVGVHVHEAGGDDAALGVYLAAGGCSYRADVGNPAVDDAEIAADLGCPCPVNDAAVSDDQVEHLAPPVVGP